MKIIKVEVEECSNCLYVGSFWDGDDYVEYTCRHENWLSGRKIPDELDIPDWCPLEDAPSPRPDFLSQALNEGDGTYRP